MKIAVRFRTKSRHKIETRAFFATEGAPEPAALFEPGSGALLIRQVESRLRWTPGRDFLHSLGARSMITEVAILAALDEPRTLDAIRQRVVPDRQDTVELQMVLMQLRAEKKVKFDILNGRWSKA